MKRRAQNPPEGSLPARGNPKLGVSDPHSRAQAQVRGQEWSSSAEVSKVVGTQYLSSCITRAKGSSRKDVELPLKVLHISVWSPSAQNASPPPPPPPHRFEAEEREGSLLTNAKLAVGAVSSILRDSDLKKVETMCIEEALALSLQGTVSVCLSAFFYSSCRCVDVVC